MMYYTGGGNGQTGIALLELAVVMCKLTARTFQHLTPSVTNRAWSGANPGPR